MRYRKRWAPLLLALTLASTVAIENCAKAPPVLSPAAQTAFYATRVVKVLDVLQDFAIAGNAQQPPVLSTANTRIVVNVVESSVKTINAVPNGWQPTVVAGLNQLPTALGPEYARISPYVELAKALIAQGK